MEDLIVVLETNVDARMIEANRLRFLADQLEAMGSKDAADHQRALADQYEFYATCGRYRRRA